MSFDPSARNEGAAGIEERSMTTTASRSRQLAAFDGAPPIDEATATALLAARWLADDHRRTRRLRHRRSLSNKHGDAPFLAAFHLPTAAPASYVGTTRY
ncbi:hypothetical protein GALMADRAFT_883573 [Galerina marginata CBS 339.88]|uniref:Uncharacterized protein n=1 Tax=Galerina marginata (strain CBS 339.88) TaxID=685588 RepID=A0A067SHH4_GALM3|nr:hypothetical protein GALMADRAFT_883573 [Galerina marginata CBS 339.88]